MTLELWQLFGVGVGYLALLFLVAWLAEHGYIPEAVARHPLTVTLSLGVYATSWSYYGSVGFAHEAGFSFLTIYLGVTIAFLLAPILSLAPAFAAWAVVPFDDWLVLANVDAGLLFVLALTSMGVYGVIIAGWASNSKYAFLGALRSAAQIVSYEIAMGFALVGVIILSGSLNLIEIVNAQSGSVLTWFWLPLLPLFVVYFISGVAETNRAPFDVAEGESEIVAGFHVDYSGAGFAVFFLAEYANMILISFLAALLFMGGWLSPFQNIPFLGETFLAVDGIHWMLLKGAFFMFLFLWFRATFPRYRYDQIMRLGWKVFIPITIVWILVAGVFRVTGLVGGS